ncbi:MAG: hypothetical protein IPN22_11165 [Bacteroidetes bacterium]|jgi:hypothetical protein|nr:hypothetical protein [Bacteroidota bacterium]
MIRLLGWIKSIFNKELNTLGKEVDNMKDILLYLKTKLNVQKIKKIEDVYAGIVVEDNIKWLQMELERDCLPNEIITLQFDDYVVVEFVTMVDGHKYQFAKIYHTNFKKNTAFFKQVKDYPYFQLRCMKLYEDGFYYPFLKTSPKEPVKIIV